MPRRTKIVATVGPASADPEVLGRMIDAGMNVVRVNLSHGEVTKHLEVIRNVRALAAKRNVPIGVLADLPGPKIRTTTMEPGVVFEDGATVDLKTGDELSTSTCICTDYPTCASDLQAGDSISIGDGGVSMEVTGIAGDVVQTVVRNGGAVTGRPGLHLPSDRLSVSVPTDEDRRLLKEVVLEGEVDFVAVSFVKAASEILEVKMLLGESGCRVVAKIETPTAVENLEEITMVSDAVMVARGDLGTECPLEDVPVYQKRIIRTCLAYATPVITATQMLESMITAATPTRAEASDVANAVCDGTDAVMLSAESAIGRDPVHVVETMARIAQQAEVVAHFDTMTQTLRPQRRISPVTAAITHGAWQAAMEAQVSAILCCTRSGSTAHVMASLRPDVPLYAMSTDANTVNRETLTWGAIPVLLPHAGDFEAMINTAVQRAIDNGYIDKFDLVAVLSGSHDLAGSTNNLRLLTVGET